MGSKNAILILGLLAMVLFLMISSEVAARDLAEVSSNPKEGVVGETNEVGDAKYGSYPGHGGNGGSYPGPGHGGNGGSYPGHGGGYRYPPRRGYCRYGCCGGEYHGGCRRCCSYAGEAVAVETQDMTRN